MLKGSFKILPTKELLDALSSSRQRDGTMVLVQVAVLVDNLPALSFWGREARLYPWIRRRPRTLTVQTPREKAHLRQSTAIKKQSGWTRREARWLLSFPLRCERRAFGSPPPTTNLTVILSAGLYRAQTCAHMILALGRSCIRRFFRQVHLSVQKRRGSHVLALALSTSA